MAWIVIFLLISLLILKKSHGKVREGKYFLFAIFFAVILGTFTAVGVSFITPKYWEQTDVFRLINLQDENANEIGKNSFLRISRIWNTPGIRSIGVKCYSFYKEDEDEIMPGKVIAIGNTIVKEEERLDGMLKVYVIKFNKPLYYLVALQWPSKKYEFFIPQGGLKNDSVSK